MEIKHTKGEWKVSSKTGATGGIEHESGFIAFTATPRKVSDERLEGESWLDMRDRTQPERDALIEEEKANARLIASAPELLSHLEFSVKLFGMFPAISGAAQLEAMRSAIKKATQG